ncbi:hypothetical protein EM308_05995 [Flavobacterium gilvum]|uniref:Macroglobulin domain-containing protein n=2 Tax=Flavobacterium gilvum TaxID=1492737 RepID=A0AAC9I568_9FLAO|nr:hypothetical protein EM308_05995 [Flavobacterium gilvum]KFC60650.1 hypothetical protein FEM08_06920 [Flavobacterium gilvum]
MLCYLPAYSQNSTPTVSENKTVSDNLAEQLQSLSKNNASDLVYLQTSKGIYETEEDLWFKGYVLDAQNFTPSARNKILFVQLIADKTDKAVWENKYEIENGFVNGHLFLQDTLQEGTYTLAAYSSASYTRNTNEFYAVKKLEILKTINHKAIVNPVAKDSILQFTTFPEGGNLVSGIQGTLGFKAVNSKGIPVNVSATLYENNKPLLDFKSSHAGMGSLIFTPDANKEYHIQLTEPKSKEQFSITHIYQNGKVLQLLRNTKEALTFKVSQSAALNPEIIYLRFQVRGVVYSIASGLLKKELTIKIPLNDIPQGIAEVTLFGANTEPLAERLVYVNQDQKLNIKTELDKSNYNTRDKASLKIKVTDENGQPVMAHLGLSVYDKLYQNQQDSKNILTHYFLSTQLKGNIYNPAYYFDEKNKDRQEALNLLLLTQGWRSYVWEEFNLKELGNIRTIVFDDLKAKVNLKKADAKTKELQPQGITIFSADEKKGTDLLMADETGAFTITPNDLKKGEGGYIYLKLLAPPESNYHIGFKDFSFEEINKERKIKTVLYPISAVLETKKEVLSTLPDRPGINKLKEVLITSKKKKVFRDKYIGKLDSLARVMQFTNDFYCTSTNYLNCPRCKDGCCPGTRAKPVEGGEYVDTSQYTQVSPCGPYLNDDSKVLVYHYYSNLTEAELLSKFNIVMFKGYYGKKVFYEPIYDEVTINDSSPDYRNTIFWKPDIITNEQGEATVDFFCSDINTVFLGNIEGVSGDGLLGVGNFEFTVRKNAN